MLKTKSGFPAYDAETMAQARVEYQKFMMHWLTCVIAAIMTVCSCRT